MPSAVSDSEAISPAFAAESIRPVGRWCGMVFGWLAGLLITSMFGGPAAEPSLAQVAVDNTPRVGAYLRITAPVDSNLNTRLRRLVDDTIKRAKQRGEWPVFVLEIEPGRSEFGAAFDLASFLASEALNGATTVAYIPQSISGHAVLVALACDEIIMAPAAEIGRGGEFDAAIGLTLRNAYVDIASRRNKIPGDVALALLDPAVELSLVETDVGREFVLRKRLDELREEKLVKSATVLKPAGRPWMLTGADARELGLISYLAADLSDVARAQGVSADALREDPSFDGQWRTVRIDLTGHLTPRVIEQARSILDKEIAENNANFICFMIDSPGGPASDANFATYLPTIPSDKRRTVAYVPKLASGDAALLALACDLIVVGPDAVLGGHGATPPDPELWKDMATTAGKIAEQKLHNPALARAMFDPDLSVFRYTRKSDGLVDYFSEDEFVRRGDQDQWSKGAPVTQPGRPLVLRGDEAERLGIAHAVVTDWTGFRQHFRLENDPRLVEPGWVDYLVRALNSDGVKVFVLMLGFAALVAELQAPGIGVGGFIATVCFLLFFWSAYLGGTAGWLEVLLFVSGVVFILMEIFVLPGVGIFGLGGGLMVIASIILASQTFIIPHNAYQLLQLRNSVLILAGAGAGALVFVGLLHRLLPHTPVLNRMLLSPPSGEELHEQSRREALALFDHLLGVQGQAVTPLMPAGKAQLGEELVDVITDGEYVERGQPVRVVQVRGNRVLVRGEGRS